MVEPRADGDAAPDTAAGRARGAAPAVQHRAATPADVPALGRLYTTAFDDNPAYGAIFQLRERDAARHAAALEWLFQRRARLLIGAHGAHCLVAVDAAGALVAAAAILPRSSKPGIWAQLRVGLLLWPLWWGMASLKQAFALDAAHADAGGAAAASDCDADLSMVVVHPSAQGRGVGSALMAALLAQWDASGGGALALGTQRAINVPFYERHAFRVVATRVDDTTSVQYKDWFMRREKGGVRTAA